MILRLENIEKDYLGTKVLKGINLSIDSSGAVILGPSGSGKSTILKCINFLETPTRGNIYFKDEFVGEKNISKIRQKVSMVFQQFFLFNNMNVLENLTYAPLMLNIIKSKEEAIENAQILLKKFNIENKAKLPQKDLSGGQKQRVAICRSLMMNPEVILFDEPTSALDVESVKGLINIIKELEEKITVIVVTHHVEFAKSIAKRIIFLNDGLILEDSQVEAFFNKPKSHRARIFLENTKY